MKRILLLTFSLLLVTGAIFAQTSLEGKITDEDTKEPILFGSVSLYQNGAFKQGVNTDVEGNYSFGSLDPGNYSIEISYTGYPTKRVEDVVVAAGKTNFVNLEISNSGGITLEDVVVVAYKEPLFEKDQTETSNTITSEEIRNLPTRNINALAATTAGLGSADEGGALTVRGSRSNATNYYIDGVRVNGNLIPESEIEQLQVITGGLDARYGDVTGGIISLTTKGPSSEFAGGLEAESSRFLDDFNQNLVGLNLSGPILKNKRGQSILGYRFSGRFTYLEDDDPSAVPLYRVNDETLARLEANPLRNVNGNPLVEADFLTNENVDVLKTRPFEDNTRYDLTGKIDARLSNAVDVTLTGAYNNIANQFTPGENTNTTWLLLNAHNNPTIKDDQYRVNFRIRHRLGGAGKTADGGSKVTGITNAYYTLQGLYEKRNRELADPRHGDNYFAYGHVGNFDVRQIPVFDFQFDTTFQTFLPVQADYRPVLARYNSENSSNPVLANYNNTFGFNEGELLPGVTDFAIINQGELGLTINDFNTINGNRRNIFNNTWGLHSNVGSVYNQAFNSDSEIYTFMADAGFDLNTAKIGKHSIRLGIMYEGRTNRSYNVAPFGLWTLARQSANTHLPSVDPSNRVIDSIQIEVPGFFSGMAPVLAPTVIPQESGQFYLDVRESLGLGIDEFVNVDGLRPDQLRLDMFSAEELTNANLLDYNGYDYLGNEFNGTFDDFFTARDPRTGNRTLPVAPDRPIYTAAYIQDKFSFRDIIFRVGVRIDRYDANTKVLKDPYSLYDIIGADDFHAQFPDEQRPGNIGDDYAVYTTEDNGTRVQAYRNGDNWFQADGTPTNGPQEIDGIRTGLVFPKYANPEAHNTANFIKSENFTVESSFEDYEVQLNVMPRLAFSFPISDDANFFAHYDVLVQRPASNTVATALDYFYFVDRPGSPNRPFNNPNLRPTRTVDYEVGFRQKLSDRSAVKIAAYYKEMRDMIQIRTFFPVPLVNQYTTFDNQDFGTIKGFNLEYDLRRTSNLQVNANYTLQFADGTGSDVSSQRGLTNRGNLRTLFPLNFDERHRINLILDYRLGGPKTYVGPDIFANAGINVQAIAVSGRPYTSVFLPTQLGGSGTEGAINGARTPFNFTLNFRIDKQINIGNNLGMNVYARVSNALDRRNTINVYPATGSPDDPGYLDSRFGRDQLENIRGSSRSEEAFLASYQWRVLNPDFFSLPRRIYLGTVINF